MNKYDRRKLNKAAQSYCCVVMNANSKFSNIIDTLKSNEEDKLENMPESLRESRQASNIEEAVESLSSIQESLEAVENTIDEIEDITGVTVPAAFVKSEKTDSFDDGPRTNRFQILLPDQLLLLMKMRAMALGISCNELICQALQNELLNDPKA